MAIDGPHDHIERPLFSNPNSAMTAWFRARSTTPTWKAHGCLLSKGGSFLFHPWAGEKVHLESWVNGRSVSVSYTPDDVEHWHHDAGTFDGQAVRFHVNGKQVASAYPASSDKA